MGRGYGSNPIIALSAPVLGPDDEILQVVEGSVDVRRLRGLHRTKNGERSSTVAGAGEVVVLDRELRVLFALGETQQRPLSELVEPRLTELLARSEEGRLHWTRGDHSSKLVIWQGVDSAGWRVLSLLPGRHTELAAASVYLGYASGLLVAVLLTTLFATAIALRITRPIERLVSALHDVEADSLPESVPEVGSTAPREVAELIESFGAMAGRLEHSYQELRHSLDERQALNWELEQLLGDLDRRVRERTGELAASRREALELQKQFRGLLDDIEAIVCEYDLDARRFTFVSRRVTEILGYPPEAWYEDRVAWLRLLPAGERATILSTVQGVSETGGSYALEHPTVTADGEVRWLRNVGRVLVSDDGSRLLRCVMLDVTAVRRAQEDQLRRRQLESVGTLAGGIAHDFNNLLTAVLGNLSLARLTVEEGGEREELFEILGQIEDAGENARRLAHQLLTFARGGRPIRRPCRLGRLLRQLERGPGAGGESAVTVELEDDLPRVLADRQQLGQVVHELLRNAEQAMPEGGRIEIRARLEAVGEAAASESSEPALEPGDYVAFSIGDQGAGVPPDLLSKVFDPYFTTKDAGRGFGLAATYSIVQNHGGHVSFHSVEGQGTTVTVWLPAASAREEPEAAASEPEGESMPGRLLLMDDEPSVRLVATRMLRRLGWQVNATADGREAIEAYRRAMGEGKPFDLVLTDLTVPGGLGGADTMLELRRIDPEVRAVVCSGYSSDPVMASYREHGFVGVMTKPFSLADLDRVLGQALHEPLPEEAAPVLEG